MCVFALLLLAAAPAEAASPPPPLPGDAAVDQYREGIPAGGGPVAPGATGGRSKPLPKSVEQRLERVAGANGALLSKIATSPDYGAPAASRAAKGPKASQGSGSSRAGSGQAAGATAEPAHGTRLWPAAFLVVALLAVSALAAAVVMRRRGKRA